MPCAGGARAPSMLLKQSAANAIMNIEICSIVDEISFIMFIDLRQEEAKLC